MDKQTFMFERHLLTDFNSQQIQHVTQILPHLTSKVSRPDLNLNQIVEDDEFQKKWSILGMKYYDINLADVTRNINDEDNIIHQIKSFDQLLLLVTNMMVCTC